MGKKTEFTVKDDGALAATLCAYVAGLGRSRASSLIKSGEVRVNGVKVRENARVFAGDIISVFVPDGAVRAVSAPVVYEDDSIVVFDKPKHTPYDRLADGKNIYAVHRLDTNTSGLIVFAKTEEAKTELEKAFKERRAQKVYEAVVLPAPKAARQVLTAYMAPAENNTVKIFDSAAPGRKTVITEYEVEERVGEAALLRVMPHTGRMHQIRAHMKFIGCPIVGDGKYGAKRIDGAPDTQMLAAVELSFSGLTGALEHLNGMTFKTESGFDLSFLRK